MCSELRYMPSETHYQSPPFNLTTAALCTAEVYSKFINTEHVICPNENKFNSELNYVLSKQQPAKYEKDQMNGF